MAGWVVVRLCRWWVGSSKYDCTDEQEPLDKIMGTSAAVFVCVCEPASACVCERERGGWRERYRREREKNRREEKWEKERKSE